jgi:predicted ATPase/class 3 adenylate cyclase
VSTEQRQIEATIAGLEAQRPRLGDALVDAALAPLRERLAARGGGAGGGPERQTLRQVSVLFMDVVGSTTLSRGLDPEDIHAVMDGLLARCTAQVAAHGGKVLQYAGDSLLAAFGAKRSREDDAERAVRAGLALLDEGAREGAAVERRFGHRGFGVRVGVHTGEVLLGGGVDADGSIRGITVNVAARMEQSAPAGALRISADTHRLVHGAFETERQAPLEVKGLERPLVTYLVTRARPAGARRPMRGIEGLATPMVGREAELAELQRAFEQVGRARAGRLVTVIGEAGLGKSRLLDEFRAWLGARADPGLVFGARAQPPTQDQPFGLLRDLLAAHLGLDDADSMAATTARFEAGLMPLLETGDAREAAEAEVHLLGQLLGLDFAASPHVRGIVDDGRQIRRRGLLAATRLVQRLVRQHGPAPAVLWLDDLHWADDGTLDFVEQLVRANAGLPLLVVALARPLLDERRAGWGAAQEGGAAMERIALRPLGDAPSQRLADALLARLDTVPADLRASICGRAEGNPFYMEELVKMLVDQGVIEAGNAGWRLVRERLDASAVPKTLTGVLQARLDRLAPAERRALQQAAVVGPAFSAAALAAIDAQAPAALPGLVERALVVRREGAHADDVAGEYRFGHQLLHQVVYGSVLRAPRRRAHAQVAAWLAAQHGARANDFLGATADHYERAGDTAQAAEYHARAVEHAGAVHAHESALAHAARALALVDGDDGPAAQALQWRVRTVRERTFDLLGRRAEQVADLDALDAIADAEGDDLKRADVLKRRSYYAMRIGDSRAQERTARAAMALAERCGAVEIRLRAQNLLATALGDLGQFDEARALVDAGIEEARAHGLRRVEGSFLNSLSVMATQQEDVVAALDASQRQWEMFRDMGDRPAEAVSVMHLGIALLGVGERERAKGHLAEGLRLTRAVGDRAMEPYALTYLALIAARDGDAEAARRHAEEARVISVDVRNPATEVIALCRLAELDLEAGRLDSARQACLDAHALALASDDPLRFDAAAGLARVALARGDVDGALAALAETIARLEAGDPLDSTESRQLIRLTCYQALTRAGDPRADAMLRAAHDELMHRVALLTDAEMQRSFVDEIPEHRAILAAWQARAVGRTPLDGAPSS